MTEHAAGADLAACLDVSELTIAPGQRLLVGSGCAIELPVGYEAQVRPRSGLALKFGVTILNTPGTIDADYRGEVRVLLVNLGGAPFTVRRGMRIAQLVIAPNLRARMIETTRLDDTVRNTGGFGSTGSS